MLEALQALQPRWQARGLPVIHIGIGITSGTMIVGNMGSDLRFSYTVMGDEVNLGARLEGVTKEMGLLSLLVKPLGSTSKTALPPVNSILSVSKGKTGQRVSLKYSVCCHAPRPRPSWCNALRKGYRPIEPDGGVRPSPFFKQLCRKSRTIIQVNSTFSAVRSSR